MLIYRNDSAVMLSGERPYFTNSTLLYHSPFRRIRFPYFYIAVGLLVAIVCCPSASSLVTVPCSMPLASSLQTAYRHLLCDCASTILFLLLYSFVNVYYLSLVSAKNAEGMKRIQAGGEVRSTEPLLRVRKQISAEGTTESLSPPWGFTHSCLPCRGSATLHRLPMFCRPFQD